MASGTEAKPLVWLHGEIKTPPFSLAGRIDAGELLRQLQRGEPVGMPHSRPLPSIGSGCHELRISPVPCTGARQMKRLNPAKLRRAGWRSGSFKDFLGLSDSEAALVEMRAALRCHLRERRVSAGLSQSELAARIGSSQSRVAKMEAGDASVSLDLLIRSLLALGASTRDIARAIAR